MKAESALYPLQQQLDAANSTKKQLEDDNVALYGNIRYLKTLAGSGISSSSRSGFSPAAGTRIAHTASRQGFSYGAHDEERAEIDREGRYSKLYETRMSPFAQFAQTGDGYTCDVKNRR